MNKYVGTVSLSMMTVLLMIHVPVVKCHGRMIDPPARSSAWRYGFPVPVNYDDNDLSCGRDGNRFSDILNGIRSCGVCGDPFQGPRENEAGGKYATGFIVRNYTEGQRIQVKIEITANHGGFSQFRICPNNNVSQAVTQQCLDQYPLAATSGEIKFFLDKGHATLYIHELLLPPGLVCTQCVLQWIWTADSIYNCNPTTPECCGKIGCGPQEHWYGCADVSISGTSDTTLS